MLHEMYESILTERKSEMEVFKRNRIELDDDEREKVMKSGAVWHHGPDGKPSAGVWKTKNARGDIKYVCNTHRAYEVSDTLDGAIKNFDFIKTTS